MHDTLPPYVEAKDYLRVRAWVRGWPYDAVVIGWRGDRVYLSCSTDMGRHLGWVPAADVDVYPVGATQGPWTASVPQHRRSRRRLAPSRDHGRPEGEST